MEGGLPFFYRDLCGEPIGREYAELESGIDQFQPLSNQSHIASIACLFVPQLLTKRVSLLRLLSHQALVLGWTVRVSITSWL